MITEDYVSFETAKLLKEKGFDELCPTFYETDEPDNGPKYSKKLGWFLHNSYDYSDRYGKMIISAPTLQMAMKWLREVHHIFINIDWDARPEPKGFGNKPYFSLIINMNIGDFYKGKDLPSEFTSYEEAAEAAIKYCLENLI